MTRASVGILLGFGLLALPTQAMLPLCREVYNASTTSWANCRVQIGGLANRGASVYNAAFGPTFNTFLNQQLNASHGLEFESIPLSFASVWEEVANGLDFVFVNPAQYVCIMSQRGATAIVTLKNQAAGAPLDRFAGLMIARANSSINSLEDLRHARVEATSLTSLGGAQLQFAEMLNAGLHPMVDIHRLTFARNQNQIVQDVLSGETDVGFVRHDIIHLQAAQGLARLEDFKIINSIGTDNDGFPFERSTGFTPEWPVAALPHVPEEVRRMVMLELLRVDSSSPDPALSGPAVSGRYVRFTAPMNYYDLLRRLSLTGFYDAASRSCPAGTLSTYDAIVCPASHFKHAEESMFCADGCRDGHVCLCNPCEAKPDAEVVFSMRSLPHVFPPSVDAEALIAETNFATECGRLEVCARLAEGQPVQAVLVDRVRASTRLRLDLVLIENVTFCTLDGSCQHMIFNPEASAEGDRYELNLTFSSPGVHVVRLEINGILIAVSPILVYVFEPPQQHVDCPPGHELRRELGTCHLCTAGNYLLQSEGGPSCVQCPPGHFQNREGQTACMDCPAGEEAHLPGSTACSLCLPGSSTRGRDSSSGCDVCEPGQVAPLPGMSRCESCERGSYSEGYGATICSSCPVDMTTLDRGQTSNASCGCIAGLYRDWGGACQKCPEGMLCELGSDVRNMPGNVDRCAEFFCTFPRTLPGYMTLPSEPLSVYKCLTKTDCPGASRFNVSVCAPRRAVDEPACGLCAQGNFMTRAGDCKACGGNSTSVLLVLIVLAFVVAVMVLGVAVNCDVVKQRASVTTVIILCGVFFTMLQTLSVFAQLNLDWVDPLSSIMELAAALSFDITELRVSCHISQTTSLKYLFRQLIAPSCLPLLVIALLMKQRFHKQKVNIVVELCNASGTILSIFFISVIVSAVDPLVCYKHPQDSGNGSSMLSEPAVLCWEGDRHGFFVAIGFVAFILVPLNFLAMCTYVILLYPRMVSRSDNQERTKLHAFRFLFFRFKPKAYFYGLLALFRNLAICLIPAVVPAEDLGMQIAIICMILLSFAGCQATLQPWRTLSGNVIDTSASMVLVLIILCGVLSTDIPADRAAPTTVGTVILIVALLFLLSALFHSIYCRCCRRGSSFDYFICHHKHAAAAQARYLQILLRMKLSCSCFLDSDDLTDLSMLFETIKSSVKHFLVLLTKETLQRPWCAGEITIAKRIKVTATAIIHPSFTPPDAELEDVASYLDVGSCTSFMEHYIDLESVAEALRWVSSEQMARIDLIPELPGRLAFDIVIEHLQSLRGRRFSRADSNESRTSSNSSATSKQGLVLPISMLDTVVVSCDHDDLEAIAAAGILMQKLLGHLTHAVKGDLYLLADADEMPTVEVLQQCLANARAVIVMMTHGTLENIQQIQVIVGVTAGGSAGCRAIPVSSPQFMHPGANYYEHVLPMLVSADDVALAKFSLQSFFGFISLSLGTHASDAILVTQCQQVFMRIGETAQTAKNADTLRVKLPVAANTSNRKTDDDQGPEPPECCWAMAC